MGMLVITEWAWCLETQHTALPTHTFKIPWAFNALIHTDTRINTSTCALTHTNPWNQHYWQITFSQCICKHTTGLNCLKNVWMHSKNSSYAKFNIAFCWIIICNYLFVYIQLIMANKYNIFTFSISAQKQILSQKQELICWSYPELWASDKAHSSLSLKKVQSLFMIPANQNTKNIKYLKYYMCRLFKILKSIIRILTCHFKLWLYCIVDGFPSCSCLSKCAVLQKFSHFDKGDHFILCTV